MIRLRHAFAVAAFAALAPSLAMAQTCPGPSLFADVQPSDSFCKNTEWLYNRGVTLGCTAGPPALYCPYDFVTRAQMALFMNRLGTALTPKLVRAQDSELNGDYDPPVVGCISPAVAPEPPIGYSRQASFHASFMNYNASSPKTVIARFVYSTNGGATWVLTPDFEMWQSVGITNQSRTTMGLVGGPFPLEPNTTYLFGIQASTNDFSATVQGECQLLVRIENRNPDTPPF